MNVDERYQTGVGIVRRMVLVDLKDQKYGEGRTSYLKVSPLSAAPLSKGKTRLAAARRMLCNLISCTAKLPSKGEIKG